MPRISMSDSGGSFGVVVPNPVAREPQRPQGALSARDSHRTAEPPLPASSRRSLGEGRGRDLRRLGERAKGGRVWPDRRSRGGHAQINLQNKFRRNALYHSGGRRAKKTAEGVYGSPAKLTIVFALPASVETVTSPVVEWRR